MCVRLVLKFEIMLLKHFCYAYMSIPWQSIVRGNFRVTWLGAYWVGK